jgi:cytoskeleton protein RodZ
VFEIGSSLREARERQGLDLAAVERETKIRGKYIRALEDEQFELLPAQTYVKGFLRTYAETLGLDGQLYVDEYNSRFVAGDDDTHFRPRRSTARQPQQRNRRLESGVVLLVLAAIAIVTVVVIGAWTSSDKQSPAATPKVHRKAVARQPAAPATGVLLVISALHGNSLLEVHARSATGPLRFQGTILRRQVPLKFWATRLWVNAGTPENLRFTVNGRVVTVPGGSPRVLLFTRAGVRSA